MTNDYEVSITISVTADSISEAVDYALNDLRDEGMEWTDFEVEHDGRRYTVNRLADEVITEIPGPIGYDRWEDFEEILSGRGGVDVERIPQDVRDKIVDSYPYGEFDPEQDCADQEWEQTGGPWFDTLEDNLIEQGYGAVCDVCGEQVQAKVHTDAELDPDDAADGLHLHPFTAPLVRSPDRR